MNLKRLYCIVGMMLAVSSAFAQRTSENFDKGWHFAFGDASSPEKDFGCGTAYFNYLTKANSIHNEGPYSFKFKEDDGEHQSSERWRTVDLPFDFVVDLPFNKDASFSHGFKEVGHQYPKTSVGWYRKAFVLPADLKGKHIRIRFDGIFRNSQIWVNNTFIGGEQSGYISQDYDITDYLFFGDTVRNEKGELQNLNLVCVRADASLEEGWFYEGGGIYRHTWLEVMEPVHVVRNGVFLHATFSNERKQAELTIETELTNDSNQPISGYTLQHEVVAPNGSVVATAKVDGKGICARQNDQTTTKVTIDNPVLWDIDQPNIYKVRTKVLVGGKEVDCHEAKTGLREIVMDKDKGFFLNGRHIKLTGFDCHQDHAGVGAGIPDGLQHYRLARLKWMGANCYRASHNPMTPELLDACDEMGILVFAENRLMGINPYQLRVAEDMIRIGRNHPSVFTYSIANEEWGLEWDNRSIEMGRTMANHFRRTDPTRPIAVASSSGPHILQGVDIAGYNYVTQHDIDGQRRQFPNRLALGSEETTGCGTRGIYFPQSKESGRMPSMNREADKDGTINRIARGWKFYDERPWLLGLMFWTGFDYRGEPVPLQFPATGSQFGILDYCGFPKDEAYYLKAWWKQDEPLVHILPHWNLQGHEGETIDLWVYSNCDEVELKVNGKNMGRKKMERNGHLSWEVVYQPGRVEAIGYQNGKRIASERLETTGEATQVKIEQSQYGDIIVADLSLLDKKGRFVPTASQPLTVTVSGNVRILGWGNGDSAFTDAERPACQDAKEVTLKSFNGHAQVILQSSDGQCSIKTTL